MAFIPTSTIAQIRTPSQMKLNQMRNRAASPSSGGGSVKVQQQSAYQEAPVKQQHQSLEKSSSDPELGPPSSPSRKRTGLKKLKNIRSRISVGKSRRGSAAGGGGGGADSVCGEGTDGSESGAEHVDRAGAKNASSSSVHASQSPAAPTLAAGGGTPPRHPPAAGASSLAPGSAVDVVRERTGGDARETIDGGPSPTSVASGGGGSNGRLPAARDASIKSQRQHSGIVDERRSPSLTQSTQSTKSTSRSTSASGPGHGGGNGSAPPIPAMPSLSPSHQFQFISDDNFTRRVDSYDGQVITCSDSKLPTYEVGNYLGGGVAGVVYEGKRLRPAHEYPPIRVRGGGAFYPNTNVEDNATAASPGSPVAMTMKSSSLSSARRVHGEGNEAGSGLFAEVFRSVVPERKRSATIQAGAIAATGSPAGGRPPADGRGLPRGQSDASGAGGCASFLFGNCGYRDDVDDRAMPLSSQPMVQNAHNQAANMNAAGIKERYQAVDMASIEVPAAFSSMDQENTPTGADAAAGGGVAGTRSGIHHVVVDDADAPNRSRREARALSRKDASAVFVAEQPRVTDMNGSGRRGNSFLYDSEDDNTIHGTHLIEDMSETVAVKILNPVGFRLLDPEMLHKAVIVREGSLPEVNPDGSFVLKQEHVWWLVNPNSRNLRSLLRKNHLSVSHGSSLHTNRADDASEESSLKRQGSLTQSFGGGGVDRGSPERGLRLSLVATYVDPATNRLRELPLPRCVEIWGHPPFAATDEEFEAMMEALLRLNSGGSSGLRKNHTRSGRIAADGRTRSQMSRDGDGADPLTLRRHGSTVFCPALSAYIAVPAVPPKYLRWLKQRRLATKEVRNMMRIGRHRNVVHLYEVLEMVQDSKSTMFLILELVRGGELFDLISSNSSSKRKKDCGATENELHEVTMRKFFGELASGINFIHSCGVAHRDLKPENLLIHTKPVAKEGAKMYERIGEEERTLKIADFGLSAAFQLHPTSSSFAVARFDTDGGARRLLRHQSSGLPLSPPTGGPLPGKSGLSPLLNRVGATALSMLTCGSMTNVCVDEGALDGSDLVDGEYGNSIVDLRRMTSVVGSPHYVSPEIIAQADKGNMSGAGEPQDRKARHAARAGYDGTKADVWSAGVILYAMLFRSLPFGEDLLRCPRYQAFQKWYADARVLQPPPSSPASIRGNRRARPERALDPEYDEFDEEEMLGPHWFFPSEISAPGRDLIVAMLNPDPADRLTVEMVLRHPWLRALREGLDGGNGHGEPSGGMPRMSGLCISGT